MGSSRGTTPDTRRGRLRVHGRRGILRPGGYCDGHRDRRSFRHRVRDRFRGVRGYHQ
jgi:hypothetical protein